MVDIISGNVHRRLTRSIRKIGEHRNDITNIVVIWAKELKCNIYLIDSNGQLRAHAFSTDPGCGQINKVVSFMKTSDERYKNVFENKINCPLEGYSCGLVNEYVQCPYHRAMSTIIPIYDPSKVRLGTVVFINPTGPFNDEDILIAEWAAAVIAQKLLCININCLEEQAREKEILNCALTNLTFSEKKVMKHIITELNGNDGFVKVSYITRSTGLSNYPAYIALKKLVSAGIIETRPAGPRGIHIKILHQDRYDQLSSDLVQQ